MIYSCPIFSAALDAGAFINVINDKIGACASLVCVELEIRYCTALRWGLFASFKPINPNWKYVAFIKAAVQQNNWNPKETWFTL